MSRLANRHVPAIASVLLVSAPIGVIGQGEPSAVPRELVAALLSYGPDLAHLRVGGAADGVPIEVMPPNAAVLGSLIYPTRSTTVLTLADSDAAARESTEARLTAAGWRGAAENHTQRGFVPAPVQLPLAFCRGDEYVAPQVMSRPGGGSLMKVHYERGQRSPMCDQAGRRGGMMEETPMPTLFAPRGVQMRGSGSSGGGDTWEVSARLETRMAAVELLVHDGSPLRQAGWSPVDEAGIGALAMQLWRLTDGKDERWWGVLNVVAMPEASSRHVSFRIGRE